MGRLVLIEWLDACSHPVTGWRPLEQAAALEPALSRSVGWILSETASHLVLAAHESEGEVDGDICIPRGCISRIAALVERP